MMISGPMPAASPMVIAMVGRVMQKLPSVRTARRRSRMREEAVGVAKSAGLRGDGEGEAPSVRPSETPGSISSTRRMPSTPKRVSRAARGLAARLPRARRSRSRRRERVGQGMREAAGRGAMSGSPVHRDLDQRRRCPAASALRDARARRPGAPGRASRVSGATGQVHDTCQSAASSRAPRARRRQRADDDQGAVPRAARSQRRERRPSASTPASACARPALPTKNGDGAAASRPAAAMRCEIVLGLGIADGHASPAAATAPSADAKPGAAHRRPAARVRRDAAPWPARGRGRRSHSCGRARQTSVSSSGRPSTWTRPSTRRAAGGRKGRRADPERPRASCGPEVPIAAAVSAAGWPRRVESIFLKGRGPGSGRRARHSAWRRGRGRGGEAPAVRIVGQHRQIAAGPSRRRASPQVTSAGTPRRQRRSRSRPRRSGRRRG